MNDLGTIVGMHRTRNGRLGLDYMSRTLVPRWKQVNVDGVGYDRKALADWILARGSVSPASRRPLNASVRDAVTNSNPYGIYGKAPMLPTDLHAA